MVERLLIYLSISSALIPLIVAGYSPLKKKPQQSRVIFLYLAYSLFNDLATTIVTYFDVSNGVFFFNSFYTIIEHILILIFFVYSFQSQLFKKIAYSLSALFIIVAIITLYRSFINLDSTKFDSIASSFSSLLLIIYSVYLLYEKIQIPDSTFVYGTFEFWIVVGLMIYFSGTFFLFLQAKNLTSAEFDVFWKINLVCNILKNIFFAIAFYQLKKQPTNNAFNSFDN